MLALRLFCSVATAAYVVTLNGVTVTISEEQKRLSQFTTSDPALQGALSNALDAVEALRMANRSTQLHCTEYFSDFNRYQNIEPYISFFKSISVPLISVDLRQTHIDYFQLTDRQLWSFGYKGFARNDRLVISFTKTSESSREIIGFSVTLLNDTNPF